MNLSTAIEGFLKYCTTRKLAAQTITGYRSDLTLLAGLASVTAVNHVSAFTPELVRDYFHALAKKGLTTATLHRRRASISQFAQWCLYIERCIADDPMAKTPTYKRPKRPPRPFRHDSRAKLAELSLTGVDAVIRGILYDAGLRVSELCQLHVGDVDLGATETSGSIRVLGKGDKVRVIPLPADLRNLLQEWMLAHCDVQVLASYVLTRANRKAWTRKMVWKRTRRWGVRAELDEKVTPHRFRHTYATRLLEAGADVADVKELLGHEDINTTLGYTEVAAPRLRNAVNRLTTGNTEEKVLFQNTVPSCDAPSAPERDAT